jgi:hypothetical protein
MLHACSSSYFQLVNKYVIMPDNQGCSLCYPNHCHMVKISEDDRKAKQEHAEHCHAFMSTSILELAELFLEFEVNVQHVHVLYRVQRPS